MSEKTTPGNVFAFRNQDIADKVTAELKQSRIARAAAGRKNAPNAARATHHVTGRMQGYGIEPLRANELKSVFALFAWVANQQGAAEETVQSMTETRFRVNDIANLPQKDYDEAIRFLVDLRIDEMQH